MTRIAAAIVLALAINPAPARAQDAMFTVSVRTADVYKGPSTGTPVIGHVARGTVLPVARNLGSWVKVPWPDAQDGVGYLHVSMGRLDAPGAQAASLAPRSAAPAAAAMPPPPRTAVDEHVAPRRPPTATTVTTISHTVGVGGLVGSRGSIGASARAWRGNHLGVQLGFTRDVTTGDPAAGRVSTVRVEPGVVYALRDRMSDYVWVRPYVGSAVTFDRQTWSGVAPAATPTVSDSGVGYRLFAGSELTFASLPRLGVSLDLGYGRSPAPFPGFEVHRLSVSMAGHWYVR